MNRKPNDSSAFMLGALFSLGTFTRITFPVYGIPIGIALLIDSYRNRSIRSILQLISGLLLVSGLCILIDSLYYQTLEIHNLSSLSQIRIKGVFTITPLNNLIYNTNVSNLESHGLHPWYTHLLVNMPLLYGPLFIYLLVQSPHLLNTESHSVRGILFTSLLGLSLIPHQEARFLCPLLIPLVLIYTSTKIPASFYLLWILFNIITSYVFGIAHQGGLVLAMGFLQRQTTGIHDCSLLKNGNVACSIGKSGTQELNGFQLKTDLVFYKTYMPPQHLLVYPKDHHGNHVKVFDYASDLNATVHHLSQSAPVILTQPKYRNPRIHFAHTSEPDVFERTLLITPSFIPLPVVPHRQYLLLASYSPHISFDDMDFMLQQVVENTPDNPLSLNVFLILSST
ncbi:Alg9-like mannosyltransferase family-domain-containing protein [Pilobolus umbonatus]|nr:Alg9-like mannosyltransferase family-domain-containing protein [Pilobolus umbonatus]